MNMEYVQGTTGSYGVNKEQPRERGLIFIL